MKSWLIFKTICHAMIPQKHFQKTNNYSLWFKYLYGMYKVS